MVRGIPSEPVKEAVFLNSGPCPLPKTRLGPHLRANYDFYSHELQTSKVRWDEVAALLSTHGVSDDTGKPPKAQTVRKAWYRLSREMRAREVLEPPFPPFADRKSAPDGGVSATQSFDALSHADRQIDAASMSAQTRQQADPTSTGTMSEYLSRLGPPKIALPKAVVRDV